MNSDDFKVHVFSLQCRTCLQSKDNLTPIFESEAAEMLNECEFCLVAQGDGLPNQICTTCLQTLQQCYAFKKMCKKSEARLREAMEHNRPISEEMNLFLTKSCNSEENSLDSSDELTKQEIIKIEEHDIDITSDFPTKEDLISFLDDPLPPPLPHQCQHCNHSFSEENDLKIHQSVHNPELVCLACSKRFTGRQTLKRHLKIHLIQKPHVCRICNKSFSESYGLVKHLRIHAGIPREKRHFCDDCGQGFSEPYYLKVHMRKHTGERPLVCPICQKRFADPRSFKTHGLIHSGDRPFKCNICPKSFIQNANFKKHLRVHSGEKPFLCKLCGKKFSQACSLDKHFRIHSQACEKSRKSTLC